MLIEKEKTKFLIRNLIYLSLLWIITQIMINAYSSSNNWAFWPSIIAIITFVWQLVQIYYYRVNLFDFRCIFVILHYLFIFGRVFLYGFERGDDLFWNLTSRYSNDSMHSMALYSLCAIQAIFIGVFISVFNREKYINPKEFKICLDTERRNYSLFYTGIVLFIIGVTSEVITDYRKILSTFYTGSYTQLELDVGIFDDIAILFVIGILLMICSNVISKKGANILIVGGIGYNLLIMMLSGDRRYQVCAIISLICLFLSINIKNMHFSMGKVILISAVGIMGLNFLYIIREFRAGELQEIGSYIANNFDALFSLNFFYETVAEFGISFFSLCSVDKYIPSVYSFQYGKTFIYSLGALLPLGLMEDVSFYDKASYSNIINNIEGASVGCTLIGDFYINFSWFGIIFLIFWGALLGKIVYKRTKYGIAWDYFKYYSSFYIFLTLVRATISQSIRPVVIGLIFPLASMIVFNNILHRRGLYN